MVQYETLMVGLAINGGSFQVQLGSNRDCLVEQDDIVIWGSQVEVDRDMNVSIFNAISFSKEYLNNIDGRFNENIKTAIHDMIEEIHNYSKYLGLSVVGNRILMGTSLKYYALSKVDKNKELMEKINDAYINDIDSVIGYVKSMLELRGA